MAQRSQIRDDTSPDIYECDWIVDGKYQKTELHTWDEIAHYLTWFNQTDPKLISELTWDEWMNI